MYFVIITKNYINGEPYVCRFGRTTEIQAKKLYDQEVRNAEKVVNYISATAIKVELVKKAGKVRLLHKTIEPR